jgi:hypothetical protein
VKTRANQSRKIEQKMAKKADFRESAFQLAWANSWMRIDTGKGSLSWGPGRTGNLLLSNNAPSYGLFRLQASELGFIQHRRNQHGDEIER